MKNDESEVVATSTDLSDVKQTILIVSDDKYLVINQNKRVSLYSLKTGKYVTDLLQTEVVEAIWSNNPDDDFFFALTSTENKLASMKVKVPTGKISKKNTHKIDFQNDSFQIQIQSEDDKFKNLYYLKEVNKSVKLLSQSRDSPKLLSFGEVQMDEMKRPLMSFNSEIVVRVCQTVTGKPGCSLLVSSVNGSLLWSLKWDSDRPISAIKCCPKNKNFAVGDNSGRIRVYKDSTKESFSQAHWHSLPIQALQFSQDGVHLYSGGHEGAILKWDIQSMKQVGIVPRIGTSLIQIVCTFEKVICVTSTNSLKIFTTHLEDVSVITGLAKCKQTADDDFTKNSLLHHSTTNCLVVLGSGQQQLQFFDPIERRQKLALEAISENIILGERKNEVKKSQLELFDISDQWIATIEKHWDGIYIMKLWEFQDNNFSLNTAIRDVHMSKVSHVKFVSKDLILTCGSDGFARLWKYLDNAWILLKALNYLKLNPICGVTSKDKTVLAISYGQVVVLYDLNDLKMMSALVSKHIQDPCTTLAFGFGQHAAKLLSANVKGVFIWDLLSLRLIGQFQTENSKLYAKQEKEELILSCKDGLFDIDGTLNTVKICSVNGHLNGMAVDSRNQRLYYMIMDDQAESKSDNKNVLKYARLSSDAEINHLSNDQNNVKDINKESVYELGVHLNQLSVNISEDIFYARVEAPIVPDMITTKVSNCSEMIIKRMLPR